VRNSPHPSIRGSESYCKIAMNELDLPGRTPIFLKRTPWR
jgi:hypothetical protein